jgi:transposase-like protein
MTCHNCKIEAKKSGKDRKGNQRYRCNQCRKTFQEMKDNLLGTMRIPIEKAEMCLQLLLEGMSIRSIQRITDCIRKRFLTFWFSLATVAAN